ncbi:mannose-specific lectin-like [Telopea speciosissima]|uniref:mannose-specific lectin-like n=1 Tax=Telopea speciosissima TaxID=54955 RepID=UPI001CC60EB2|nr:mannose-specific lectin-like [Telopea speciosissima]
MGAIAIQTIITSALLYFFLGLLINNPAGCEAKRILFRNEVLKDGYSLQCGDNLFKMQHDCNLVLYHGTTPVWASNTGGLGRNCHCRMQSDGNLVVYNQNNRRIWATNTSRGEGHYVLILHSDGNVIIYGGAIWTTKTSRESDDPITSLGEIGSYDPQGYIMDQQ